jgi:TIR domain
MTYTHDIFISYRRDPETVAWIKEHLSPLLRLRLGMELGNHPDIYTDERLEAGGTWPVDLGRELARSKVLISLWSANYLHSQWCTLELAHMVARERAKNLRTPQNPSGIVLLVVIHDGDAIPHDLQVVQRIEIQKCFNVRMRRDSTRAEELDAILTEKAAGIARAIREAPQFEVNWPEEAARAFFDQFHHKSPPSQTALPQFTEPLDG